MISRETVIGDMVNEDERVQYDEKDVDRLRDAGEKLIYHATDFFEALDKYTQALTAPADEDSMSNMAEARRSLVETWAFNQAALSRMGWILRIDGQEAFARLAATLKTGKPLIVSDL